MEMTNNKTTNDKSRWTETTWVLSIVVGLVAGAGTVWCIVHMLPDFGPLPLNRAILVSGSIVGLFCFGIVWAFSGLLRLFERGFRSDPEK